MMEFSRGDLGRILADAKAEKAALHRRAQVLRDQILAAECQIANMSGGPIPIDTTDHAVVRFIERVEGYNVADLRNRLACAAYWGGACDGRSVIPYCGVDLICENKKVLTVVNRGITHQEGE